MGVIKLRQTDWGVAYRANKVIYVHKNLREENPLLYEQVMDHERRHSDKAMTFHDFVIDFLPAGVGYGFSLWKYMFKHPKCFVSLLPVFHDGTEFCINLPLIFIYLLIFCFILFNWWLFL